MTASRPSVLLLAGLPGAGKTTSARQLEHDRPAVRFTLDEWMLRLHGLRFDEPEYAERLGPCQEVIWQTAAQVLAAGVDVVLDWNQWSRDRRALWTERARAGGHAVTLFWIDVPVEVAIDRAQGRTAEFAHRVDGHGVRHLASLFEPPTNDEGIETVRVVG
jgi:predicted kinase